MSNITLKVNGKTHTVDVEPSTPLLYILRNDMGLQGPRFGCGLGQCGACTVIIRGEAVRSCIGGAAVQAPKSPRSKGWPGTGVLHPIAGLDSTSSPAVRLLPERANHDREGIASTEIESHRAQIRQGWGHLVPLADVTTIQAAIKRAAKVTDMTPLTTSRTGIS